MDEAHLIGVRDPHGFWPLVLGRIEGGWVLASETAALDIVGAHFVREVEPGEMVVIDAIGRARSTASPSPTRSSACSSSSTSRVPTRTLYGHSVHAARQRMGEELARQAPVDADMVMPVPESGIPAAQGYARASRHPLRRRPGEEPLRRAHVHPAEPEAARRQGVRLKLNPLPREHPGQEARRRRRLDRARHHHRARSSQMLREAGAAEVHFRVSSPPYRWPCFYGMDTGSRSELLAADMSVGEIRDYLGVDSLAYLELDRLVAATGAPADVVLHRVPLGRLPGARARSPTPSSRSSAESAAQLAGRLASRRREPDGDDAADDDDRSPTPDAGVDIAAGEKAVELIKAARALDVPARGGRRRRRVRRAVRVRPAAATSDPLLVSSTDGVGTKSLIARLTGRYDTIGIDSSRCRSTTSRCRAPSRCSSSTTSRSASSCPRSIDDIVAGVADGAARPGCALLGGEMSEHPDLMEPGEFDLVGFAVGVVERAQVLPARRAAPATRSSASPARACAATATRSPARRCSTAPGAARRARVDGRAPLARRRAAPPERDLRARDARSCASDVDVHAFAHVTGGGIPGNLVRVLPDALRRRRAPRHVGGAADLRRDPGRRRRRRRRDGSTSSTSASGCWRLSPRTTASLPSTSSRRQVTKPGSSERCQKAAVG